MTGILETHVGKHVKGATVRDTDFPEGRFKELASQGKITPTDGIHPVPVDPKDAKGWKARAESLEAENMRLRKETGADHVAATIELEKENAELTAESEQLRLLNAELTSKSVSRDHHQNVVDQLNQLTVLHETTVKELERVTALLPKDGK